MFFQPYLTGLGFIFKLNKNGGRHSFMVVLSLLSLNRSFTHTQMNDRIAAFVPQFMGFFFHFFTN